MRVFTAHEVYNMYTRRSKFVLKPDLIDLPGICFGVGCHSTWVNHLQPSSLGAAQQEQKSARDFCACNTKYVYTSVYVALFVRKTTANMVQYSEFQPQVFVAFSPRPKRGWLDTRSSEKGLRPPLVYGSRPCPSKVHQMRCR